MAKILINAIVKREPNTNFDRTLIAAKRAERRFYFKAAAYTRTVVQRSFGRPVKKRPRPSAPPGQPPRSNTKILKKSILFAVETKGAVVGAIGGAGKSKTAAKALEHGGKSTFFAAGRKSTADYAARPFMAPGLKIAQPKFSEMWKDAINNSSRK